MHLIENEVRRTNRDRDKVVRTSLRLCSSPLYTFIMACSSLAFLIVLKLSLFELWVFQSKWLVVSGPWTLLENERRANCVCEPSEKRGRDE